MASATIRSSVNTGRDAQTLWDEFKEITGKSLAPPEGRVMDCVGGPDVVRAQLRKCPEEAGVDQVVCLSQAGKIPHEMLCESTELFAAEVLPEFKGAGSEECREEG